MAWSALIGLGASLIGQRSADRQASRAMAMRADEMDLMREQFAWNRRMADRAFASQEEENEYQRAMEALNRRLTQQERQFDIRTLNQYDRRLAEERQFEIDRMVEKDREQARLAQAQLEQMLRNQDLSREERAFAVKQLDEAKRVAAGEREEDMRRFYEERAQAESERNFALEQFYGAQTEARRDQERDLALRDRMIGQIDGLQDALSRTMASMGGMPDVPVFDEAELIGEIDRRTGLYQSDVERAGNIAASQNEANLIRAGIDSATPGTARRADVARSIADELQKARGRAYDDALAYITGKQGARMTQYNAEIDRRARTLDEVAGVEGAGMEMLRSLPGYRSLADQGELANGIRSGVYSRGVSSANNYSAPVTVGTAIYDSMARLPSLSNAGPQTSRAHTAGFNLRSGVFAPTAARLNDPTSFTSAAGNMSQSLFGAADDFYVDARDRSARASQNFGSQFQKTLNDVDWGSIFNMGNAGGRVV